MPIVSGVAFGVTLPYTRVQRGQRAGGMGAKQNQPPNLPTRPSRISSISDFAARAAYKYDKSSRLVNQYKLYSRRVDTPTIGTIISIEF
ncbi:MAG: hypothetical protein FWG63_06420 [Defluviitaleaceae bacterium]|nr:hypothetical protein [Defluviitaleaceae bacterium]